MKLEYIKKNNARISVAPLVGARIEILDYQTHYKVYKSLPSWERGLKLVDADEYLI